MSTGIRSQRKVPSFVNPEINGSGQNWGIQREPEGEERPPRGVFGSDNHCRSNAQNEHDAMAPANARCGNAHPYGSHNAHHERREAIGTISKFVLGHTQPFHLGACLRKRPKLSRRIANLRCPSGSSPLSPQASLSVSWRISSSSVSVRCSIPM